MRMFRIISTILLPFLSIKAEMCFYIKANSENSNPRRVEQVEKFVESHNI